MTLIEMETPLAKSQREKGGPEFTKLPEWRLMNGSAERGEPFGPAFLDAIDPKRTILTPAQHNEILKIEGPECITKLLRCNIGRGGPKELAEAHAVFGDLAANKFDPPKVALAIRFYTVAQYMEILEIAKEELRDKKMSKLDRQDAKKRILAAMQDLGRVCTNIERLMGKLGFIKTGKEKKAATPVRPAVAVGSAPSLE